jgi:hypothetical protein
LKCAQDVGLTFTFVGCHIFVGFFFKKLQRFSEYNSSDMRKFNLYMHEHTGELNQIISKTIASIEFNVEAPEFLDEYFNICQLIVLSMVRHPT